jgi:hypothetical protein
MSLTDFVALYDPFRVGTMWGMLSGGYARLIAALTPGYSLCPLRGGAAQPLLPFFPIVETPERDAASQEERRGNPAKQSFAARAWRLSRD